MRKKTYGLLFAAIASVALCACGGDKTSEPVNDTPAVTSPADHTADDTSNQTPSEDTEQTVTKAPEADTPGTDNKDDSEKNNNEEAATPQYVPVFSAEGGFYDKSFTLTISEESGCDIFYTLDGSDPRTSDTAEAFPSSGISIYNNTDRPNVYSAITDITLSGYQPPKDPVDKGIIVRAVAKTPSGEYGKVVSNSYFVGKNASYYSKMKVVSLVTDSDYLFDKDTGAYMIGSKYYEWLRSEDYVAYDSGDVQNPTNYNTKGKETEFPVSVQVFENGQAVYSGDVGARLAGNWSRAHAQKSIRLYARKEYGDGKMRYAFFDELTDVNGNLIEKFDAVTFRNGGNDFQTLHFRDALIQELVKDLSVDTMASEPCVLFIDGEFWGFYMIREKVDADYIEGHYSIDSKEVAVIKNSELEDGEDSDLEAYREFSNWAATADMTDPDNYKKFCDSMDVQNFIDYMAVETYINNHDWANGSSNNWEVWRSKTINPDIPNADGKWRFVFYDIEFSTGLYGSQGTAASYDSLGNNYVDGDFSLPSMLKNLCNNEEFRQTFYDRYTYIIENTFAYDKVNKLINTYEKAYSTVTKDTYFRFGMDWAAYNYENEVTNLKAYFRSRPSFAARYLEEYLGMQDDTPSVSTGDNMVSPTYLWNYYGNASAYADAAGNTFTINVYQKNQNIWDVQSQAEGLLLENGHTYKLSFEASSQAAAEIAIGFNRFDGFNYPTCWWEHQTLTTDLKYYEFYITINENTHNDWRLCYNFGYGTGEYVIKNVTLVKVD